MDNEHQEKCTQDKWNTILELGIKMMNAVQEQEDKYYVMIAAICIAGHLINCFVDDPKDKKTEIKNAMKLLRWYAHRDLEEAIQKYALQQMPTVGSVM